MNNTTMNDDLIDLMTERALGQLSAEDEQRLIDELKAQDLLDTTEQTQAEIELAIAAAMNAMACHGGQIDQTPMPEGLEQKLHADAEQFFGSSKQAATTAPAKPSNVEEFDRARNQPKEPFAARYRSPFLGWAVAATLAFVIVLTQLPETGPVALNPSESRLALIDQTNTEIVTWAPSEIPAFNRVSGDVVWNNTLQQGYLRLVGMPANDPTISQYQLWIVDPERDANPIDGGVFDVLNGNREVIIPIDAKLDVLDPEAFAITREQPGGVVVSNGPLLMVATS